MRPFLTFDIEKITCLAVFLENLFSLSNPESNFLWKDFVRFDPKKKVVFWKNNNMTFQYLWPILKILAKTPVFFLACRGLEKVRALHQIKFFWKNKKQHFFFKFEEDLGDSFFLSSISRNKGQACTHLPKVQVT